jgi:hypothetical protein
LPQLDLIKMSHPESESLRPTKVGQYWWVKMNPKNFASLTKVKVVSFTDNVVGLDMLSTLPDVHHYKIVDIEFVELTVADKKNSFC